MSQNDYGNDNFAIILLYIYLAHNNIQHPVQMYPNNHLLIMCLNVHRFIKTKCINMASTKFL